MPDKTPREPKRRLKFEPLEPRLVLSSQVFISEFMASNDKTLTDKDGQSSDWIEIHNAGPTAVNLDGWALTDDATALTKWRLPAEPLAAGGYLVVFASGKDLAVAGSELHTNFKLDGAGEYLALVRPDGVTIASECAPTFPEQHTDVSYGAAMQSTTTNLSLVSPGAAASVLVPTDASLETSWNDPAYVPDATWTSGTTGVGYETQTGYESLISTDVETAMYNKTGSVYIRIPFTVDNPAQITSLTLRMKYDDGYVAFLNGQKIAEKNPPATLAWNSQALQGHADADAVIYEDVDVSTFINKLKPGANVLAIQGMNTPTSSSDFLIMPELVGVATQESGSLAYGYMTAATPGRINSASFPGFVADTKFDVHRGFFDAPFAVTMTTATPDATIRYTTDGKPPTATTGTVYTGPLTINKTTTLRAAAFKTDYRPTNVDTETYIFLADVIRQSTNPPGFPTSWGSNVVDYGMDPNVVNNSLYSGTIINDLKAVPTLSIVTDLNNLFGTSGIYSNPNNTGKAWERPASLELIYPDGTVGFQIDAGLRLKGGYSRSTSNPKHALRFCFRDEYGSAKLKYPLFGDAGAQSFENIDLRAFQNYSWSFGGDSRGIFIRDSFSRDTQLALAGYSSRGDFFHLYIDGQYWGLYNTAERPEAAYGESYFGGNKDDYDVIKVDAEIGYGIEATDGNMIAWNKLYTKALAGLGTDAAYQFIQGNNPDGTRNPNYEVLLDVPALINYMLVILYTGNFDSPVSRFLSDNSPNNWYGIRNRTTDDGFRFFAWDSEHTLLDVNDDRTTAGGVNNPQRIWQQLSANAEFRLLAADYVQKHFFNGGLLTPQANIDRFMARKNQIDRAVVGESARWGDAKREPPLTRNNEWLTEINRIVTSYFPQRTSIVVNQLKARGLYPSVAAPSFSQFGGIVPQGYGLMISGAANSIYYTDDGTDPRLPGGAIAPTAKLYTGPVVLMDDRYIRARVLSGTTWSAVNEATFMVDIPPNLRVSELMYNPPAPPAGGPWTADDFEYIELTNIGTETLDLTGIRFTRGVTFDFTGSSVTSLAPGQYVLVVKNQAAFASRYHTAALAIAGEYADTLADTGELVKIEDATGGIVSQFTYGSTGAWATRPNGQGSSLEVIDPTINPKISLGNLNDATHWRASSEFGGSPGAPGTPPVTDVVINEVLAHPAAGQRAAIELYNTTGAEIDISGWYLSDTSANFQKFALPPDTLLPAHGYLAFDETQFNAAPGTPTSFALNAARGGEIHLVAADGAGMLTRFANEVDFPAMAEGESYGRYPNATGALVPMRDLTLGSPNSVPRVGPVVISAIMYRPPEPTFGVENTLDEYIALANVTANPVTLSDWFDKNANGTPDAGETVPWKLDLGVYYSFTTGTVLPGFGSLVVVSFNPTTDPAKLAAFRALYNLDASVPVVGPWTDKLDNFGETVRLRRPDASPAGEPDFVPYLLVEEIKYDDAAPWPAGTSGTGAWLVRLTPTGYGNDSVNWVPSYFVVDNKDAGFSTSGTWLESGSVDEYAKSSVYSNASGSSAAWTPNFALGGSYEVYAWWSRKLSDGTFYDRDSSATYTVTHAGGATTIGVDQDLNYGQWVRLGTFDFAAGASGSVRLNRGVNATAMETTSADAIKFVGVYRMTPRASGSEINDGAAQRSAISTLSIQFLGDVSASLDGGDLTLRNDTSGAMVSLSAIVPAYDHATNTATWDLSGARLDDGYYTAKLAAAGVTDAGGNPLVDGDYAVEFFRLLGDTDGSGAVDIFDVAALQVNYGQTAGMASADGDFDGNGTVDIFDVALLQTQFGKVLTPPGPPAMPAAAPVAEAVAAMPAAGVDGVTASRLSPTSSDRAAKPSARRVAGAERSEPPEDRATSLRGIRPRAVQSALRRVAVHGVLEAAVDRLVESEDVTRPGWDAMLNELAVSLRRRS
jgi:hypothetical protein